MYGIKVEEKLSVGSVWFTICVSGPGAGGDSVLGGTVVLVLV
jgi:hypothetical protein